jgi:hypothetical protein
VPSFSFCETFFPSQARRIFMPVRLHGVGTDRSAATFVKRGSPNPRAVSAHTGDYPSRRTGLGLTVLYKGSGRAPPSFPWHAFYRAGRAASRAQL